MRIAISISGSLVFKDEPQLEWIKSFAALVQRIDAQFGISVGGGKISKRYIESAKGFDENNYDLDMLGITISQANARLLKAAIPTALFFTEIGEAAEHILQGNRIAILGGTAPGQTTDAVSALLAEEIEAERWINISNVRGVHNKNPELYEGTEQFEHLTHKELLDFTAAHDKRRPREDFIIDLLAAKIIARSKIEAHFVSGLELEQVENAILGKKHNGTVVGD